MTTQIVTKIEMISATGCANIMPFNPKILFKIIIDGIKNNEEIKESLASLL